MTRRRLRVRQALQVLPELEALLPLRQALIGASEPDAALAASGAAGYSTLDTRMVDAEALEAQVEAMAETVRARTERVLRHGAAALRAAQAGDWAAAARALVAAGEVEEGERRLEAAAALYRRALELGRKPRDRAAEGLAERRLGRVARLAGRRAEAETHYRRGLAIAEAARDVDGAVVACQGLGNVAVDEGRWEPARQWYARGLSLVEPAPASSLHWQLYNNLAVATLRAGALAECEAWLQRARGISDVVRGDPGRFALENNEGRLLMAQGRPAEAEAVYRAALDGPMGAFTRCRMLVNLAESQLAQGRPAEAERAARDAELTALRHGLLVPLVDAYRALGSVARHAGDAEGFLFYEQALRLCREYDLPELELGQTQHEYALAEAGHGDVESACARLESAITIFRSLGSGPEIIRAEVDLAQLCGAAGTVDAGENHDNTIP